MPGSVGRLHHVGYCVELNDLRSAADWFESVLGVTFAEYIRPELGLHVLLAWSEGIELIAPLDEPGSASSQVRGFLDANGPGVFSVVVKVGDLEAAVTAAERLGGSVLSRQSESNTDFDLVLEEATLQLSFGLPLTLLQTNLE